jgi:hypothetical protein
MPKVSLAKGKETKEGSLERECQNDRPTFNDFPLLLKSSSIGGFKGPSVKQ